jgi:hypothetical protein
MATQTSIDPSETGIATPSYLHLLPSGTGRVQPSVSTARWREKENKINKGKTLTTATSFPAFPPELFYPKLSKPLSKLQTHSRHFSCWSQILCLLSSRFSQKLLLELLLLTGRTAYRVYASALTVNCLLCVDHGNRYEFFVFGALENNTSI